MAGVSVLMSCFNHAGSVGAAISSVLDQSFRDLELIVVDDASTDDSWRVIEEYTDSDPRAKALLNDTNGGPPVGYNRALSLATGEIIMSLDSDDRFLPGKVAAQVDYLAGHPDVGIVATYVRATPDSPDAERWFNQPRDLNDPAGWIWSNPIAHSSIAITRWAHDQIGRADEKAVLLSDWDKYLRALVCGIPLAVLPRPLTEIHISPTTLTHSDPPGTAIEYLTMGNAYWHAYLREVGGADLMSTELTRMLEQVTLLGESATPELLNLATETLMSNPEGAMAAVEFAQRQATKRADYQEALAAQERMIDERTRLLHSTEDTLERERETFRWEIEGRDLRLEALGQELHDVQERLARLAVIEVSPKAQLRALRSSVPASLKKRGGGR